MKKFFKWCYENLPMLLAFGVAFWAGFWLHDFEAMKFWIIMAAFFMVLRELSEIRHRLINLAALFEAEEIEKPIESEQPEEVRNPPTIGFSMEDPEHRGRHHGPDST